MISNIFSDNNVQSDLVLDPEIERAAIRYAEYDQLGEDCSKIFHL